MAKEGFLKRFWLSIAVGVGIGSQTGGAGGEKEEKNGHYGWNFLGLEWFFLFGPLLGFDILYKKFGLTFTPLGIVGANFLGFGLGGGFHIGRKINIGIFVPIEALAVIIPTWSAGILSGIIGILFIVGIIALIYRFIKK